MWEAFFENPASVYLACETVAKEVGLDTIEVMRRVARATGADHVPNWVRGSAIVFLADADVRRDVLKVLEAGARPSKKKVEEALNAIRMLF